MIGLHLCVTHEALRPARVRAGACRTKRATRIFGLPACVLGPAGPRGPRGSSACPRACWGLQDQEGHEDLRPARVRAGACRTKRATRIFGLPACVLGPAGPRGPRGSSACPRACWGLQDQEGHEDLRPARVRAGACRTKRATRIFGLPACVLGPAGPRGPRGSSACPRACWGLQDQEGHEDLRPARVRAGACRTKRATRIFGLPACVLGPAGPRGPRGSSACPRACWGLQDQEGHEDLRPARVRAGACRTKRATRIFGLPACVLGPAGPRGPRGSSACPRACWGLQDQECHEDLRPARVRAGACRTKRATTVCLCRF